MESLIFNASSLNIMLLFAITAFVLIAVFTGSTPIRWVSSLLALVGLGMLFRRMFPSDNEIKQRYEAHKAAVDEYFSDRKAALEQMKDNNQQVQELEKEKRDLAADDASVKEDIAIVDTEISRLEHENSTLEKSIAERQKKLDSFFSRQESTSVAPAQAEKPKFSIGHYQLKGDIE